MSAANQSCWSSEELREYRHIVYAAVYSLILLFGLLGNLLALWMFRAYVKETKKAVVFMINLAVADLLQVTGSAPCEKCIFIPFRGRILTPQTNSKNVKAREATSDSEKGVCVCARRPTLTRLSVTSESLFPPLPQVLSLPTRIYYYLYDSWPFGQPLCVFSFYLKYVNMYASIYFLVCISVRRCELIMRPLRYNSPRRKGDLLMCIAGWLLVCLGCLAFPLLRTTEQSSNSTHRAPAKPVCFAELPMRDIGAPAAGLLLIVAELLGFIIPLILVLACSFLTAGSLRKPTVGAVPDQGEKRRALLMVLSCAAVFLFCFAPYHITMPLDFLVKAGILSDCTIRDLILRSHTVTLCLASLNCSLDPLMYYFTTQEFWRRLSKAELPDSSAFSRRRSGISGGEND